MSHIALSVRSIAASARSIHQDDMHSIALAAAEAAYRAAGGDSALLWIDHIVLHPSARLDRREQLLLRMWRIPAMTPKSFFEGSTKTPFEAAPLSVQIGCDVFCASVARLAWRTLDDADDEHVF
jgi:hypothetical protein